MARYTLELGSSPVDEPCAQVGDADYMAKAYAECDAYRGQLYRLYAMTRRGDPLMHGVHLKVKGKAHDFGTYYEVVAQFDDTKEEAVEIAFWFEENLPAHWDDVAKGLLEHKGFIQ